MVIENSKHVFGGIIEIQPKLFTDNRGIFTETFNDLDISRVFREFDLEEPIFCQDNQSISRKKGTIRGIHLQKEPFSQGKLVRVSNGKVLDYMVDLRPSSKTYKKSHKVILDSVKQNMVYIPEGFGHAFITLEDYTIFNYKCTNHYNSNSEITIKYDDKTLDIDWEYDGEILISDKDKNGITINEFEEIIQHG